MPLRCDCAALTETAMTRTRGPKEPVPAASDGQLTGDDYENIWLRVKDRGGMMFMATISGAFLIGGALGGVGGYEIARRALEKEVAQYTQSEAFRTSLVDYTRQQIPELQQQLTALEQREKTLTGTFAAHRDQLAALQRPPIEIDAQGIRWTAPDGKSIRMAMGEAPPGGGLMATRVVFDPPFQAPPLVLVSVNGSQYSRRSEAMTIHVSANDVAFDSDVLQGTLHWIAIGR